MSVLIETAGRHLRTKRFLTGAALFILLMSRASIYAEDKIIAIVNNDTITQSEADVYLNILRLQLSQQYKGRELEERLAREKDVIINKMIEDKIILQEAKRGNLQTNPQRLKFRINEIKSAYLSEVDFENSLKDKGLTVRDLEKKINEQMIMREIIEIQVRRKIVISPDEVTRFYEKNKEELFTQPQNYAIELLYLEDENALKGLQMELQDTTDMQKAAERYKATYSNDTVVIEHLRSEAQDEITALNPGQVSRPIKLGKGFYIFKLLEILPPQLQSLKEAHPRIYEYLFEEKFNLSMLEWLENLKSKSYVSIK